MNVAIYGDSFADTKFVTNDYLGWPSLLEQQFRVHNFAYVGSSLWWSYNIFKEVHQKYDLNIFVVTVPGRIYLENLNVHLNARIENWPTANKINVGEVYYKYIYSQNRELDFHNFMVDEILKTKSIVIPAFEESVKNVNGHSLCYLADREEMYFFNKKPCGKKDKRKCHMSMENNKMIFDKIMSKLNHTGILTFDEQDYVRPKDGWQKYWS